MNDLERLSSPYIHSAENADAVAVVSPARDGSPIGLSVRQVMAAMIEPSPNTGRAYLTVPFLVQIEVGVPAETLRKYLAEAVCSALLAKQEQIRDLKGRLAQAVGERDALAADARAAAVVESARRAIVKP